MNKKLVIVVLCLFLIIGTTLFWLSNDSRLNVSILEGKINLENEEGEPTQIINYEERSLQGLIEDESTEWYAVYQGATEKSIIFDGSKSFYKNEYGKWREADLSINQDLKIKKSPIKISFNPTASITNTVNFSYDGEDLLVTPLALDYGDENSSTQVKELLEVNAINNGNTLTYKNVFGNGINLTYIPKINGLGKEIVISSFADLPINSQNKPYLISRFKIKSLKLDNKIYDEYEKVKELNNGEKIKTKKASFSEGSKKFVDALEPKIFSKTNTENGFYIIEKTTDGYFVNIYTSYLFLQNAQYPVKIDPDLTISSSTTFGGTLSYDNFYLLNGATLTVDTTNQTLYLKIPNTVFICSNCTISAVGIINGQGSNSSTVGSAGQDNGDCGGGGGSGGGWKAGKTGGNSNNCVPEASGGSGGSVWSGITENGTSLATGSKGGSGGDGNDAGAGGGAGGGAIRIDANNLTIKGTIDVSGSNGQSKTGTNNAGAGGGGAGGTFIGNGSFVDVNGSTMNSDGGDGGSTTYGTGGPGSGASGGRIIFYYNQTINATVTYSVTGGSAGSSGPVNGVVGDAGIVSWNAQQWEYQAPPSITYACGILDTAGLTYVMNQSVNSSGTCFTIGANAVTLDCVGYPIRFGGQAGINRAIENRGSNYLHGYNDTIIRNCKIIDLGTGTNNAIEFYKSYNHTIVNSTIASTTTNAILLNNTYNVTINNNLINSSSSSGSLIQLINFAENISILDNKFFGIGGRRILDFNVGGSYSIIKNNIINLSVIVGTAEPQAIKLTSINNSLFENNTIISSVRSFAIDLVSNVRQNTFKNNIIESTKSLANAITIESSITNLNNLFYNDKYTTYGNDSQGIEARAGSNNSFYNTQINILSTSNSSDILFITSSSTVSFFNVSFNRSNVNFRTTATTSALETYWLVTPNISNYSNFGIGGINLSVYNNSNILINSQNSPSTGLGLPFWIKEYRWNKTNRFLETPLNFTTNSTMSYVSNATLFNLTAFTGSLIDFTYNFFLKTDTAPIISNVTPTGVNYFKYSMVNLSANVSDLDNPISTVLFNVSTPSYIGTISQAYFSNGYYLSNYTIGSVLGRYTITVIANDTSNNMARNDSSYFDVVLAGGECDASLTILQTNSSCVITDNLTLTAGLNLNINAIPTGSIIIDAADIDFNMNRANLTGNLSGNTLITTNGELRATIRNGNLFNYSRGIFVNTNSTNIKLFGINLANNQIGISVDNSNVNISNSNFTSNSQYGIRVVNTNNVWLDKNDFYGDINAINVVNSSLIEITSNTVRSSILNISGNHNLISNNTLRDGDLGVRISGENISFIYNSISNMTSNLFGLNLGVKAFAISNSHIRYNNFTEIATGAILLQNATNVNITDNSFSFIPFVNRSLYAARDYNEPTCAVRSTPVYKGYIGEGFDNSDYAGYNFISNYINTNITILRNLFQSNTQCLLIDASNSVVLHDLASYWFRSFETSFNFNGKQDFYISNNFTNLSRYDFRYIDNAFTSAYNRVDRTNITATTVYSIYKNVMSSRNQTNFFNLTNNFIFFDNGTVVYNTKSNENINVTLNAGQFITLYSNLNDFIQNFTFSNTTYETASENYEAIVPFPAAPVVSSVFFIYNGTSYASSYSLNGNTLNLTKNVFSVPQVDVQTNYSFYWRIATLNFGDFITNSNNQTVNPLLPVSISTNCTAGLQTIFRFSFANETDLGAMTPEIVDYNLQYGLAGNTSGFNLYGRITDFSASPTVNICLNTTQPYYTIGYGEIDYKKSGYTDRSYYLFSGTRSTSTQINTTLYFLSNSLATSFQITAQSTSLNPYRGYYLQLLRWYPQNNSYNVVEMARTDDTGYGVVRVKVEDVDYRIGLFAPDGTLIKLGNPVRMLCITSPCSYTIGVDLSSSDYISSEQIQQSLDYDASTGIWLYVWNDPSQTTNTMNLTIWKDTGTSSYSICSSIGTGSVGALSCSTNITGSLRGEVYRSASPPILIMQKLVDTDSSALTSILGLILSLLLAIPITFLFATYSPHIGIIGGIIALIPALMFKSINLTIFGGFIVIGIILIQVLRQGNN